MISMYPKSGQHRLAGLLHNAVPFGMYGRFYLDKTSTLQEVEDKCLKENIIVSTRNINRSRLVVKVMI